MQLSDLLGLPAEEEAPDVIPGIITRMKLNDQYKTLMEEIYDLDDDQIGAVQAMLKAFIK